jgi:PKD repeat protein
MDKTFLVLVSKFSTNTPTSWAWTFTGAVTASSTVQNPTGIAYNAAGTYAVSLIATNSFGSDTETKTAYITVLDTTTTVTTNADFIANTTYIAVGSSVNFTDLSTGNPTTWSWTFTGGSPAASTVQNPSGVAYNAAGTYAVSLTASGANGTDTETKNAYITVVVAPTICDTLTNVDLALDTPMVYPLSGGYTGYLSGHNSYYDIAKADYYSTFVAGSELTGALFWFGVADFSSTTSIVSITFWDHTGVYGYPGAVLASQTVLISDIANDIANYQLTDVVFTTPVTLNAPYYVGVEFAYKAGDTIAVVHNMPGEITPGTAWEQWSDNTWWNYNEVGSWEWDVAHYIFPVACYQGTITDIATVISENRISVYPNPNDGNFNLSALLTQSSKLKVSVINMLGEVVYTTSYNNVMAGNFDINLSDRSAGVYSVKVETDTETFIKQIVISK